MKVTKLTRQYAVNRRVRKTTTGWDPNLTFSYPLVEGIKKISGGLERLPIWRHQKLIPRDPLLLKKLGIQKGAKINYFASFYGDWVRTMAKETKLKATDANIGMKEFVQSRKYKIPFRAIAAQSYPRIKNAYDWSVSFEPFPLLHIAGLELTAMRGLLNKKGMKIITSAYKSSLLEKDFSSKLETVARIYGADLLQKKVNVLSSMQYGQKPQNEYVHVITLFTNNIAREKVYRDLQLISAIEKGKAKTESELIAFGLKMGFSEVQVRASLKRIEKLPPIL